MAGPTAADDAFATDEDTAIAGDLFADNGAGADLPTPGGELAVVAVDDDPAAVGQTRTLASGARLSVDAEGGFTYDPTGAFDALADGAADLETFTYTIADGTRRIVGPGTFPATIDLTTLDGTDGFVVPGLVDLGRSGNSVSAAGDVNGDGIDDFVIGAFQVGIFDSLPEGEAYLVFGRADGGFGPTFDLAALNGANGVRITTSEPFGELGFSVADAGDVDGDGIGDLVLSARNVDGDGATYVVFGRDGAGGAPGFGASLDVTALDGSDGFVVLPFLSGQLGWEVSSAGDVNGDGIDDLVIGDPENGSIAATPTGFTQILGSGEGYVLFGRDVAGGADAFPARFDLTDLAAEALLFSGLDGDNGFVLKSFEPGARLGQSVSEAGDVNGDGLADLVIGALAADAPGRPDAGAAYVVFGRDSAPPGVPFDFQLDLRTLDGSDGFAIFGAAAGDGTGASVSTAGDLNGDGVDDLVLGGQSADQRYVVFGRDGGGFDATLDLAALDPTEGFVLDGAGTSGLNGQPSQTAAGDVNGDGLDDLVIGSQDGAAYVLFGRDVAGGAPGFGERVDLTALDGADGFILTGAAPGTFAVAGAGDVNGDGVDDLLVGAPPTNVDGLVSAGATYVVYGRAAFAPVVDTATVAVTVAGVNDAPELVAPLPDQAATQGAPFVFELPSGTFADVDAGDVLTLAAARADGPPLPGWLAFNPATGRFSGTPGAADVGALDVRVTATDGAGAAASDVFTLTVEDVNDPPTVALFDRRGFVEESADVSAPLKVADIEVTDDGLGSAVLALEGPDAALFEIDGEALFLRAGAALDFERAPELEVTVTVDDPALGTGPEDSDRLNLAVLDDDEFSFRPVLSLEAFGFRNPLGELAEPGDRFFTPKLYAYLDEDRSGRLEAPELALAELLTEWRRDASGDRDNNPIEGAGERGGVDLIDLYGFGVRNPGTPDGFQFGALRIWAQRDEAFTLGIDTALREAEIRRAEPGNPDSAVLDVEAGRFRFDAGFGVVTELIGGRTIEGGELVGFALQDGLAAEKASFRLGRARDDDDDLADVLVHFYAGDERIGSQSFDLDALDVVTDRRGRSVFEGRIEAAAPDGRVFDRIELQADGGLGDGRGATFAVLDADFALTEHRGEPHSMPFDDALIV